MSSVQNHLPRFLLFLLIPPCIVQFSNSSRAGRIPGTPGWCRQVRERVHQTSSDPAPTLGDDDPSSDPVPTHGDAPHVDGHYMKRKRVYGTSPSKRLPMVEEQNNLMVLYECDLHPSHNFRETIDFSYLSLHIKQSGSHGSDSQPSNKQDAPDKKVWFQMEMLDKGRKMPLHTITRKYSPNIMTTKD